MRYVNAAINIVWERSDQNPTTARKLLDFKLMRHRSCITDLTKHPRPIEIVHSTLECFLRFTCPIVQPLS